MHVIYSFCMFLNIALKLLIPLNFSKVLLVRPSFTTVQLYVKILDWVLIFTYNMFIDLLGNVAY